MGPRALEAFPRAGIGHWPTPLERADRLRDALGGATACPEIWVKREDASGLALGGNKVRKLDLLIGQALADGAEVVVTFGAWQSNHARQTAAACARVGLDCDLVLTPVVDRRDPLYEGGGNQLLDHLLGATVHRVGPGDDTEDLVEKLTAGRRAAVIPAGGSDAIGTLGYVRATVEWVEQLRARGAAVDDVVVAVSTGGTYAGTLAGLKRSGLRARATGVCVASDAATTHEAVTALLEGVARLLGAGPVAEEAIELTDEFMGAGYGEPTPGMIEALALFARTEGLVLDPVYSGKAAAALVAMVRRGDLDPRGGVLFLHTGGAPGLFAYGDEVIAPT